MDQSVTFREWVYTSEFYWFQIKSTCSFIYCCILFYRSGFSVFWDFLSGLPPQSDRCRIVVTLFKAGEPVSDTKVLPIVPCSLSYGNNSQQRRISGSISVLGVKQLFPR